MLKIVKGVALIAFLSFVAVSATKAYFTSTNTVANNQFSNGTVLLDTYGYVNKPINAVNMAPGQESFGSLIVINKGTLPVNFFMKTQKTGGSDALYNSLMLRLYYNDDQNKLVYEGPLKNVNNLQLNLASYNLVPINSESSRLAPYSIHLYQKIWLPDSGVEDNSMQGLSTSFDEVFTANQYIATTDR